MKTDIKRAIRRGVVAAAALTLLVVGLFQLDLTRRWLVDLLDDGYEAHAAGAALKPAFDGPDASRERISVRLVPFVEGLTEPTDLQPVPGQPGRLVVLQKRGEARWVDAATGETGRWLEANVNTVSEQGLLGLAFHPRFQKNGRFFLNYTTDTPGSSVTRVEEWKVEPGKDVAKTKPKAVQVLLEVPQPYQNHNAGQLAFGPDGKLYIGLGDGGYANDPKEAGQDLGMLLGSMLRVDVDATDKGPYGVPADNPFVGREGARAEIWAYGLRNPWRYSFTPAGELVVADVGQNKWEEVTVVRRGENHGWDCREATHPFEAEGCEGETFVDPVYEYGHDEGTSITGGYVYTGQAVPALKGKYVFGDFTTGRIWAIDLPEDRSLVPGKKAYALGRWPAHISSFGVGHAGELYVVDYDGRVLKVAAGG